LRFRLDPEERFALVVLLPLASFLLFFLFYPLGYSAWLSTQSTGLQYSQKIHFVGIANYVNALEDPVFQHGVLVSLQFCVEAVGMTLALAVGTALLLNEVFKGRAIVRVVALLPWAVSEFVTGASWKWVLTDQYGFIDSVLLDLGLVKTPINFLDPAYAIHFTALAYAWHLAPLAAFFILGGLQVIPEELYSAAKVDGAKIWSRFRYVQLPFLRYTILVAAVVSTLYALTALDVVLLLTGGGPGDATNTATFVIFRQTFQYLDLGGGAAQSYLLLAVILGVASLWFYMLSRK
jgi:multiple sugar transport system permease protein